MFYGLQKKFDIVLRDVLWQVLAGFGVEGRFLQCLQMMYAKDTIRINHPSEGVTSTQMRVSPPASGANKVWSKVVLSAPNCLGYIWMP
jgi:hypothetical protein